MAIRQRRSAAQQYLDAFKATHGGKTPDEYNQAYTQGNAQRPTRIETPFTPPFGSYDPALNANEAASGRGLKDLTNDLSRDSTRDTQDTAFARGNIERQRDESLADLGTSNSRYLEDSNTAYTRVSDQYGTQRQRLGEDLNTSLGNLARNYENLATNQAGQQRLAGVRGGALVQAARKREENQGREQGTIQQGYDRNISDAQSAYLNTTRDISTGQRRNEQDFITGEQRTRDAAGRDLGQLDLGYARRGEDRGTQLGRAGRENDFLGYDTQQSRLAQVQQTAPEYLQDFYKRQGRFKRLYQSVGY